MEMSQQTHLYKYYILIKAFIKRDNRKKNRRILKGRGTCPQLQCQAPRLGPG
jgi:hypothetical protein